MVRVTFSGAAGNLGKREVGIQSHVYRTQHRSYKDMRHLCRLGGEITLPLALRISEQSPRTSGGGAEKAGRN